MNGSTGKHHLIIALVLAGLDTASKYFISQMNPKPRLIPGVFDLTDHRNFGLVANIEVPRIVILLFTCVLIAVMSYALIQKAERMTLAQAAALCLIVGGALGNFMDRLLNGFVYDWILLFNTSIINLADILIGAGIAILLFENLRQNRRETIDTNDSEA
ncbi:MAG: signal peptidase II [Patescibacteria group bacterium]|nr:signal peptidase II [Patescibacteria group bacterium]